MNKQSGNEWLGRELDAASVYGHTGTPRANSPVELVPRCLFELRYPSVADNFTLDFVARGVYKTPNIIKALTHGKRSTVWVYRALVCTSYTQISSLFLL
jgi:hypothetical protein